MKKNLSSKRIKDELLIDTIKQRIKWDSRLSNSDVIIEVNNGEVIATGIFESSYKKKQFLRFYKQQKEYLSSQITHKLSLLVEGKTLKYFPF
jgi:hypothetical protein